MDILLGTTGNLTVEVQDDVYLRSAGDLNLDHVVSSNPGVVSIESDGRILDGGDASGPDIQADAAVLGAYAGIGPGDALETAVNSIEADAGIGGLWIENEGGLTVGGVGDLAGITADGPVVLAAASPIEVREDITAEAVTLTAADSPGPGDNLTIFGEATVKSAGGAITLKAGDDVDVEEGSLLDGTAGVFIFGDYGDADPAVGSLIYVAGALAGMKAAIKGGEDDDELRIGGVLSHIQTPLTVDGAGGDDRLFITDNADNESDNEITGALTAERISGFGMGGDIRYVNFEGDGNTPGLQLNLLDQEGYDLTVAGTATATRLTFGGGIDRLDFDAGAWLAPISGATLQSQNLDGDNEDESGRILDLGPIDNVSFAGVEEVNVYLGAAIDELIINQNLADLNLGVYGNAGDDHVVIEQVSGITYFGGGLGDDTLEVNIKGDPTDITAWYGSLFDDLDAVTETLIVDNSLDENNDPSPYQVDWIVEGNLLSAGTVSFLSTQGTGEVRIIAGQDSNSTLEIKPDDGPVTIVGNRVELIRGSTEVLDPVNSNYNNDLVAFLTLDSLTNPQAVAVAPDPNGEDFVYVRDADGALTVFRRQGTDIQFVQVLQSTENGLGVGAGSTNDLVISPDHGFIYTSTGHANRIGVFARDPDTGELSPVQVVEDGVNGVDGIEGVSGLAVSPDGRNLYAAGKTDGNIALFEIFADGSLSMVETIDGYAEVETVRVSDDGSRVYATTQEEVVTFRRDPSDGTLAFMYQYGFYGTQTRGLDQITGTEVEFNDEAAFANDLLGSFTNTGLQHRSATVSGEIGSAGDVDFYKFQASP
ncbi:MAG: lactonase family protein, partial [Planctomycetota bacterium]